MYLYSGSDACGSMGSSESLYDDASDDTIDDVEYSRIVCSLIWR